METISVKLTEGQLKSLIHAAEEKQPVIIKLNRDSLTGPHVIPVNKQQAKKYATALANNTGMSLSLSKTAVARIKTGGFIQALMPFLPLIGQVAAPLISSLLGGSKGSGQTTDGGFIQALLDRPDPQLENIRPRKFGSGSRPADLMQFDGSGLRNFGQGLTNFGRGSQLSQSQRTTADLSALIDSGLSPARPLKKKL